MLNEKKKLVLAGWLFADRFKYSQMSLEQIKKQAFAIAHQGDKMDHCPKINLYEALEIAELSEIERPKASLAVAIMLGVNTLFQQNSKYRKCCSCRKVKLIAKHFSFTSKMCRPCKKLYDQLRERSDYDFIRRHR